MWLAIALSATVFAGEVNPETCGETAQNQLDMQECADAQYKAADVKLNASYKQVSTMMGDKTAKDLLVKAQRAWIAFRDAECTWSGDKYRGGSLQPYEAVTCLTDMTKERTKQLDTFIGVMSH
jgi:uncharacterized protein YecT (DUF1311 family)